MEEKKTQTSFYITGMTQAILEDRGIMLQKVTRLVIAEAMKKKKLDFTPRNRDWKNLQNKTNTQRPLTQEERMFLDRLEDKYNMNKSRILTLMIDRHCKKLLTKTAKA